MKRPTSEYSRIAKGLGDMNPRYKFDNILQLDLDMPERTTEDYDGMPSAKIQSAITAILNDDEAAQENVPITALVNFQDACLQGELASVGTASSAGSSTGGKRPKSAKKKKKVTE